MTGGYIKRKLFDRGLKSTVPRDHLLSTAIWENISPNAKPATQYFESTAVTVPKKFYKPKQRT